MAALLDAPGFGSVHSEASEAIASERLRRLLDGQVVGSDCADGLDPNSAPCWLVAAHPLGCQVAEATLTRCRKQMRIHFGADGLHLADTTLSGKAYAAIFATGPEKYTRERLAARMKQFTIHASALARSRVVGALAGPTTIGALSRARAEVDDVLGVLAGATGLDAATTADVRWQLIPLKIAELFETHPVLANGPLELLAAHDLRYSTHLCETLDSYLVAWGDAAVTGKSLGVHPNTVRYRLRQLKRVAQIDLDDAGQRFGLLVQLAARRYNRSGSERSLQTHDGARPRLSSGGVMANLKGAVFQLGEL